MSKPNPTNQSWEYKVEFKAFLELGGITDPKRIKAGNEILKRIISQLLADERKKMVERIEGLKRYGVVVTKGLPDEDAFVEWNKALDKAKEEVGK